MSHEVIAPCPGPDQGCFWRWAFERMVNEHGYIPPDIGRLLPKERK